MTRTRLPRLRLLPRLRFLPRLRLLPRPRPGPTRRWRTARSRTASRSRATPSPRSSISRAAVGTTRRLPRSGSTRLNRLRRPASPKPASSRPPARQTTFDSTLEGTAMSITAAEVKKLRDATGAGMMDAKKALTEADGDFDKAVEILRITGAAKAAKRGAEREATAGLVASAGSALIELNSETDFVAKNDQFIELAESLAVLANETKPANAEEFSAMTIDSGLT